VSSRPQWRDIIAEYLKKRSYSLGFRNATGLAIQHAKVTVQVAADLNNYTGY